MTKNEMECLKRRLPELRFLYMHLKGNKKEKRLYTMNNAMVTCLTQISLNLLYSNKNGLALTKTQKNKLAPYKRILEKLIRSKSIKEKKVLLRKRGLVLAMLSILFQIAIRYRIDE